jgi:hypothetical protein
MKDIFNKLIEVRDIAHQIHLSKSETQAKHEALEDFYNDLLEHLDIFVEVYQGQFGLVDDFGTFEAVDFSDHIKYFEDFATFMNDKRSEVDEEKANHLNAIIDDILIATYMLLYKLKFLK